MAFVCAASHSFAFSGMYLPNLPGVSWKPSAWWSWSTKPQRTIACHGQVSSRVIQDGWQKIRAGSTVGQRHARHAPEQIMPGNRSGFTDVRCPAYNCSAILTQRRALTGPARLASQKSIDCPWLIPSLHRFLFIYFDNVNRWRTAELRLQISRFNQAHTRRTAMSIRPDTLFPGTALRPANRGHAAAHFCRHMEHSQRDLRPAHPPSPRPAAAGYDTTSCA